MATPMTAGQLERFARAHRRVSRAEDEQVRARQKLTWRFDDDKALSFSGYLPPETGAVLLQALRAARNDLEHPHDGAKTPSGRLKDKDEQDGIRWDGEDAPRQAKIPAGDLADALVEICASYLRSKIVSADNADVYQVIIHAGEQPVRVAPGPPRPAAH